MRSRAVLNRREVCSMVTAILGVAVFLLIGATAAFAQALASAPPAQHATTDAADQNKQLADQIAELRAQVARLQAAVQQTAPGKKASPKSGMKMSPTPGPMNSSAKPPADAHAQHATADATDQAGDQLMNQVAELRAQVAKLQAAMPQSGPGKKSSANSGMPTGTTGKSGGMSAMGGMAPPGNAAMPSGGGAMRMMDDQGEMGGMPPGGKGGMSSAPAGAMGMCCMGEMGGMAGGSSGGMTSAMPGQPGASHLYHIGSNGFFLNHPQHITLTADQRFALNRLKERAILDQASEQRKIDQGEQELYALTGADQFDNAKVQAKIAEIERLRAEQRMTFIRTVGDATNVLTHEQHQALMGTMAAGKK